MTAEQMSNASDEELMAAYLEGVNQAIAALWLGPRIPPWAAYHVRIARFLEVQFGKIKEHDREQLLDEVLLKVVRTKEDHNYDPAKLFRPWLFTLTRNAAIDFLRKAGREWVGDDDQHNEESDTPRTLDRRPPATNGFEDDAVDRAYTAIADLPADQREVLLLLLNGLKNQTAAAIIGISDGECTKRKKLALKNLEMTMQSPIPDSDSLDPTADRFFRRLQERHEHELELACARMKQLLLNLDAQGRIVGLTEAARRGDINYINDHLRGVLPLYLVRQGIDTRHADSFYDFVKKRLEVLPTNETLLKSPFRAVLAGYLDEFCLKHTLALNPAADEGEFLRRLLGRIEAQPWVAEMKEWLKQGTIQRLDDLVDPLQWPASLYKQKSFRARMEQMHESLLGVLHTERDLLDQ